MAFWKRPAGEEEKVNVTPPSAEADLGLTPRGSPLEEDLLRRFGRIRSALSPGTVIQGKLSFDSPVRIDGKLNGEIFSSQTLLIGATGQVEADIEADTIIIMGKLAGSINAKVRIEIMPGAEVDASMASPILVVHEGSHVQGKCLSHSGKA